MNEDAKSLFRHSEDVAAIISTASDHTVVLGESAIDILYEYPRTDRTRMAMTADARRLKALGYKTKWRRGKVIVCLTNVGTVHDARYIKTPIDKIAVATPKTTAELRLAAQEAAGALNWKDAAHLMRNAIAAYPRPAAPRKLGALAERDIAAMEERARGWEAMS